MSFSVAAGINVMSATGRKRRPSDESDDDDVIDDTVAAMILMSLSCSPKSPRLTEAMIYGEHRLSSAYERTSECNCDSSSPCSHSNSSHSNSSHSPHSSHSPVSQSPSQFNDGSTMSGSQSPILSPISLAFFPSSAPTWSHLEDHEYLASSHSHTHYTQSEDAEMLTAKAGNGLQTRSKHKSNPINIPGISFAHPYANSAPTVALQSPRANNKYMRLNSNNNNRFGGTTLLQSPNKNSPNNKRGRGESRKCRKVYGMDNRDMWCTQCKWKKACSRFTG